MRAICPKCNGTHLRKKGIVYSKSYECNVQRWVCVSCKKQFQTPINAPINDLPKILLFDIETSPMEVYVWGLYKQFISHNNIIKDKNGNEKSWYVLSWAAKWLYDDDVMSDIVTPEETKERNDKRVLKSIWKLFDEADIVIAHNGDRFDIRKLNARFIEHEMNPPTPYKSIDTLKIARKEFAFVSYKQDYLTKHFKLNQKLSTEFQLWVDCINGNQERLDEMVEYNRHDVMGLEQVYLKLRPYIKNHPNLGVLMDMDVCPSCGCEFLDQTEANYFTGANRFTVYRCQACKTPYIRHKQNSNYVKTNLRSVSK